MLRAVQRVHRVCSVLLQRGLTAERANDCGRGYDRDRQQLSVVVSVAIAVVAVAVVAVVAVVEAVP